MEQVEAAIVVFHEQMQQVSKCFLSDMLVGGFVLSQVHIAHAPIPLLPK